GAGSTGAGGNASGTTAGSGTTIDGGNGASGSTTESDGSSGFTYGGGGSGAFVPDNTNHTGGAGAKGLVKITPVYAAPANDLCANAVSLPCATTNLAGTTVGCVAETSPGGCGSQYGVWYKFTGDGQQTTISCTATSSWDHEIDIFSGTCGTLTTVSCVDGALSAGTESYTFTTVNGTTYYVYVCQYSTSSTVTGPFTISRTCTAAGAACIPNTVIASLPYSQTGMTTNGAGDDFSSSDACGSSYMNGDDYTFSYTPAANQCISVTLTNTDTWVGVFVTQGCPQGGTCVASTTSSTGNPSLSFVSLTGGVTYFITISTYPSPQFTPFDISIQSITCPTPPANDDCSGAVSLTSNQYSCTSFASGTVVGATGSSQGNTCSSTYDDDDVWFSFVASSTAHQILISNITGSYTSMYFAVYSGTCPTLTEVDCFYDESGTVTGLTIGHTYYVRVYTATATPLQTTTFDICVTKLCNAPTSIITSVSPVGPITSATSVTFDVDSHTGGACDGSWEYQWETTSGTVLQAWSTTSAYTATISSTQNLRVMMRCSSCPTSTNSGTASIMFVNPMTNNECSTAVSLPVGTSCNYETYTLDDGPHAATASSNDQPTCTAYDASPDVWFSFTVPASGNYVVDVSGGTGMDEVFCLYSGTDCNSLTFLTSPGCVDYPPTGTLSGTPGETIWVRVWEYYGDNFGNFDICVKEITAATFTSGQDCELGYTVCSDQEFTGNSSGGGVEELDATNQGCMSTEHESSWYLFSPQSAGTIELAITPDVWADDYDFAIWGPYPEGSMASDVCPPTGEPLRCSWSAADGTTGLIDSAAVTDDTEDAGGDKWVNEIVVTPSDVNSVYVLLLDNFTTSSEPFTLNWTLTDVILDCTVLPVILLNAYAECSTDGVLLSWTTVSETNNSQFIILRDDGSGDYIEIGRVSGAGNSNMKQFYTFSDHFKGEGTVYYRLDQIDFDGKQTTLKTMTVDCYHLSGFNINSASLDANAGNLEINFEGFANQEYQLNLMDLSGKVIFSDSFIAANDGKNQAVSYFKPVAQGVYVVSLTNKSGITKFSKVSPR
ncbi:MAG TPA: hypothetical protein PKY63_05935, partial [Bacteroidales bacterium]|nr:hypothetical protein [Bacteroidales bacterium]